MTLVSAAKLEENCLLVSKNDMTNLVNFNASSAKSENWNFDALLYQQHINIQLKKCRKVITHDTEE